MKNLDDLLRELANRGLTVTLGKDGQPTLRGKPEQVTPALREALAAFKPEIVKRLTQGLQQIPGVPGYWRQSDLVKPCTCGGKVFFVSLHRMGCCLCMKPRPEEDVYGWWNKDSQSFQKNENRG